MFFHKIPQVYGSTSCNRNVTEILVVRASECSEEWRPLPTCSWTEWASRDLQVNQKKIWWISSSTVLQTVKNSDVTLHEFLCFAPTKLVYIIRVSSHFCQKPREKKIPFPESWMMPWSVRSICCPNQVAGWSRSYNWEEATLVTRHQHLPWASRKSCWDFLFWAYLAYPTNGYASCPPSKKKK